MLPSASVLSEPGIGPTTTWEDIVGRTSPAAEFGQLQAAVLPTPTHVLLIVKHGCTTIWQGHTLL